MLQVLQPVLHEKKKDDIWKYFCHDSKDGRILGEEIATQTSARYGGVIPSFAMGWHAEALPKITKKALKEVVMPHVAINPNLLQI